MTTFFLSIFSFNLYWAHVHLNSVMLLQLNMSHTKQQQQMLKPCTYNYAVIQITDGSYMTHIRHMSMRTENNNSRIFTNSFDLPTSKIPLDAIRTWLVTSTNFPLVFMPYQCDSWDPCNLWMCLLRLADIQFFALPLFKLFADRSLLQSL